MNRSTNNLLLTASALALLGSAFARSAEAQQCIPPDSLQEINECPDTAPRNAERTGSVPTSQLRSAAPQQEEQGQQGPQGPTYEISESDRTNREEIQARSAELLEREVQVLKRIVQRQRVEDPRRPDSLLRLAETYFEMQQVKNAAVRGFDERIFQACNANQNQSNCQQARRGQAAAEQELQEVREEMIRTYVTLRNDHPDFPRMDEVLFSLAYGLEEIDRDAQAREIYEDLIRRFPQSRFIPNAYLAFAEFYFNENRMEAAIRFYNEVTNYPPDVNPVYGYALYKSAWAFYNMEDFGGALRAFVRTIEFANDNPDANDVENLARQARRELVLPYARVGEPNQALNFFRNYATSSQQAVEMFERLGELYYDTGQWSDSIRVYRELLQVAPTDPKTCAWQAQITNAVISAEPNKSDQAEAVAELVRIYERYMEGNNPAEGVAACKSETAGTLAWLATSWHREAVGDGGESPGTNDRRTMQAAKRLYDLLVERFPDIDNIEFPNINRDDWPTRYRVAYYRAELLWKMEAWDECGPAFDSVVEMNPQGEFTSDAAYAAVLCYSNLYEQRYADTERQVRRDEERRTRRRGRRRNEEPEEPSFERREFTELEAGMLGAFQRYVCFVPDSEDLVRIKYRRARIYYEAHHYEEAALLFKDIAFNHQDNELSEFAANLYLDSLNVMATKREEPRDACIGEIQNAIDPLNTAYCATPADAANHPDLCGVLTTLKCNSMRLEAESLHNQGEFRAAGSLYVRIFRRHQECAEEANFAMDEVLYNAALEFEAARLLGYAIQVRTSLINGFPESEYAKRSIYLIGSNFHALAFYERAAGFYERFARENPAYNESNCSEQDQEAGNCPVASEALQQAVFFRIGLGQAEEAESDAELFRRNYRRSLPRETSQVVYAVGSIYERQENWGAVARHYNRFARDYRRTGLPNQLMMANVHMGRAAWEQEDWGPAFGYFRRAYAMWEDAPAAISRLENVSDAEKVRYLREALDASAEALFHIAEEKYREFRLIRFPEYRGGRSLDRVNRWAQGPFAEWVQEKMTALREAEAEYNKLATHTVTIVDGQPPIPSPPWQIAAASRIGQMYRSFVDDFRDAPIPEEIERDPELYAIYVDALEGQARPLEQTAIDRFEFCLNTSTNVRWFNEWSTRCEEELNTLDARRFPTAAELRGEPNYIRGSIGRPGPVELQSTEDSEVELEGNGGVQ